MSTIPKTPALFWVIAGAALLWNLMGVSAYLFEALSSPEAIQAAYGEPEAAAVLTRPAWATGIFAVAVFGGALGCLGLLLRRKWALWFLVASLAAVIAQQIYIWGMTDAAAHMSGGDWIMPIMIPIVAVFLVWFARRKIASRILK